jgi:hypothetical protein
MSVLKIGGIKYCLAANEGFYEDLARQNIVTHLFQLQLGLRRRRIWVSVIGAVP